MKPLCAALLLTLSSALALQAAMIENGDFAKGRDRWSGAGDVIQVDAEGNKIAPVENPPGYALEVTIHASDWTIVEQRLNTARTPEETKELHISFEVQAMPDYAPLETSPTYTGGEVAEWKTTHWHYRTPAVVFPKAPLVVRLSDNFLCYAPQTVPSDGAWRTIKVNYEMLKNKDHTLTFMFPPGTGTIHVRNVQQN
ncbi:hypothetical protein SAMN05444156_0761 [Verrucomicrobium sp. GAS474]|uniref:hypothetical protein n=1 Tax=Verrucomicrobium sp. GAS474 TaxID=1882831 RepID=UPI0008792C7D|nr:hypothetical protein [Verrucomicrobium sp. GAS474]SDT92155.1 hypothetical protein SAMN05444156_0761 [Verrucomicrobium sp. GAS474]